MSTRMGSSSSARPSSRISPTATVRPCLFLTIDLSHVGTAEDAAFLDFFYSRLRRNTPDSSDEGATEAGELRAQGYDWVSPCGPELNYVRAARTPIVFRSLSEGATPRDHPAVKPADAAERFAGVLHYGGTLTEPFRPDALRADLDGYLYHPSPQPSKKRSARERYGSYSLVGSALVLAKFREMDVGEDGSGSFLWRGRRWDFAALRPGDVG